MGLIFFSFFMIFYRVFTRRVQKRLTKADLAKVTFLYFFCIISIVFDCLFNGCYMSSIVISYCHI